MARLSTHLDMLAGHIFSVEEALGAVLSDEQTAAGLSITRLQALDFTRQSLEDCALMLQVLSVDPSTKAKLENSATIKTKLKLDATKNVLAGQQTETTFNGSGDLDLF